MKITPIHIQQAARSLLQMLEEQNVRETNDLRDLSGRYPVANNTSAYIEAALTRSEGGFFVPTLSYTLPGGGILLEAKVNDLLDYATMIVKMDRLLSGYVLFAFDNRGNYAQAKTLFSVTVPFLKRELEYFTRVIS